MAGVCAMLKREHGHSAETVTVTPPDGCSMLPLSSTARLVIAKAPAFSVIQENVQFSCPLARRHVVPPSSETSTAAIAPPPASEAVPEMVTAVSRGSDAAAAGEVITDDGASTSIEGVVVESPG